MNDLVDVNFEGGSNNPVKMTRTRFVHPSLEEDEYVRLFADSELGLVFRESDSVDYLEGLWTVL